ncbi:MAG: PQQ-binding-like beta-propeller repeat protein [Limisphaerales bacterium]
MSDSHSKKGPRWWPAALIVVLAGGVTLWLRASAGGSFQARNLRTLSVWLVAFLLLGVWWLAASRTPWRVRLGVAAALAGLVGLTATLFRIRGVSGDLVPILEPRWTRSVPLSPANESGAPAPGKLIAPGLDFPQFLGPNRTAMLDAPGLERDWRARPPQVLWRHPIGAAWSGCAIVGARALTQEQRPQGESSTCYDVLTGRLLWSHSEPAHYHTTLGGDGPRCTPTVVSNRVFTLGATGILNCLDLATGQRLWSRNIVEEAASRVPEWGFAGSPLAVDGMVVVSAGGSPDRSLLAYRQDTGQLAWSGGSRAVSYGSPFLASLAGRRQILAFNSRRITSHDPANGRVLWEYPWGVGEPQAAAPVVVGANRVLFSSGYGVGSQLLELQPAADGSLSVSRLWESKKMRAKFANLVQREGFLYGLDDGVLACLDLKDGSQRWEEGRYGHGQGLLVRGLFLLMAENGELVLLQPTPQSPNELARFRVFHGKTWNPIALSGDLLLARTDQEAACLRLPLEPAAQVPTR